MTDQSQGTVDVRDSIPEQKVKQSHIYGGAGEA
jgi:hypothetical protein